MLLGCEVALPFIRSKLRYFVKAVRTCEDLELFVSLGFGKYGPATGSGLVPQ